MSVYERLGVRPLINAYGTLSYLGGSIPHPEVMAAMTEASRSFVNTFELQRAAGRRLAELTHNEAAFVTAGAAAGMLLSAVAIMAGDDVVTWRQLPDTTGMKSEAIALAVNPNPYHRCVLPSGMTVRWVADPERPTAEELEAAIGPSTACCLYFVNNELEGKQLPLATVAEVCHRHGIPVVVDAAAQIPPFENTWRFTREMGADLAVFSGGKGFRGPQSSGLVVGTAELIERMVAVCPPMLSVARAAKASRELIVGLVTAVELMATRSSDEIYASYEARLRTIQDQLCGRPGLSLCRHFGTDVGKPFHHLRVAVDRARAGLDGAELAKALDEGSPRIAVGQLPSGEVMINAETLNPGEEYIVAGRIAEILDTPPFRHSELVEESGSEVSMERNRRSRFRGDGG
jgi:L-seryl-tRNA(Ser) seleniumtransferase